MNDNENDFMHRIDNGIDRLKESFLCAAARGGRMNEITSLLGE